MQEGPAPQERGDSIKSPLFAFFFARAKEAAWPQLVANVHKTSRLETKEKSQISFGDIQKAWAHSVIQANSDTGCVQDLLSQL